MIIFKDNKDIKFAPNNFLKKYSWKLQTHHNNYQTNNNVRILSVQSAKVDKKTYKIFPNLEWIIVRRHGYDNINLNECKKRGIGLVNIKPFTQSTADWINQYITKDDKIILIGNGAIGSKVNLNSKSIVVNKKLSKNKNYWKKYSWNDYNTLVVTVSPENNRHLINNNILSKFKGKLISVSRSTVIDNKALYKNINNITHAYIDTLDEYLFEELLATGKISHSNHTAFSYNFTYKNNIKYFKELEKTITNCLNNNIKNPILSNKWLKKK